MRAIITVIGKDMVGILAKVAGQCAACNANVLDVSQSVLQDMFAMIMVVEIGGINCAFDDFAAQIKASGEEQGMIVHVMHEDIFNSMHHV